MAKTTLEITPTQASRALLPYPLLNRVGEKPVSMNLGTPAEKLAFGEFWSLAGVDGRFGDSIRRFPGFVPLTYTVRVDALTRTTGYNVQSMTKFYLFKYAEVNKGGSDFALRGFVVVGNDYTVTGSTKTLAVFLHYDTEDKQWYTYKIAALSNLNVDGLVIDVASVNKVMVASGVNASGETVSKTLYWKYTSNTAERGDGSLVEVDAGPSGSGLALSTAPTWSAADATNGRLQNTEAAPSVQVMIRAFSPARRLWSTVSGPHTPLGSSAIDNLYYVYFELSEATVATLVSRGFTKLYCYRTIDAGGTFYLEQIVNLNPDPSSNGTDADLASDVFRGTDQNPGGPYRVVMGGRTTLHDPDSSSAPIWSLGMNDAALVLQRIYDPFLDAAGNTPAGGLLMAYGSLLVARDAVTASSQSTSAAVRWSSLFSNTPENFPEEDHTYRPAKLGSSLIDLVSGGDYGWAIRDDGIVRLHHNGTTMAINELYRKVGGVRRYGAATAGDLLFVGSRIGLLQIDGTSGRQDVVAALERVFISPDRWAKDLTGLRMVFDGALGALMILNTTFAEMFILWYATGAVTSLEDVPFLYVTEGVDPVALGPPHAWWLSPQGVIYRSNFDRKGARQTLCGTGAEEIANGRVSVTGVTDLKSQFKALPAVGSTPSVMPAATGFYVHFLSGQNINLKRKISAISTASPPIVTLVQPLPYDLAADDRFAVAPITMKVGLHGLRSQEIPELFSVKTSHAVDVALKVWSGDVDNTSNPGADLVVNMHDTLQGVSRSQSTQLTGHPSRLTVHLPHRGHVLLPELVVKAADVDVELLAVNIDGTIEATTTNVVP